MLYPKIHDDKLYEEAYFYKSYLNPINNNFTQSIYRKFKFYFKAFNRNQLMNTHKT